MATAVKRTKVPPKVLTSDDFTVTVGGKEYRPHAGEQVEAYIGGSVGDAFIEARVARLFMEGATLETPAEQEAWTRRAEDVSKQLSVSLADKLVGWTWTDNRGAPLPPPTIDVIERLTWEELTYLFRVTRGIESKAERKNA